MYFSLHEKTGQLELVDIMLRGRSTGCAADHLLKWQKKQPRIWILFLLPPLICKTLHICKVGFKTVAAQSYVLPCYCMQPCQWSMHCMLYCVGDQKANKREIINLFTYRSPLTHPGYFANIYLRRRLENQG